MKVIRWLIILLVIAIVFVAGIGVKERFTQSQPLQALSSTPTVISIDEALEIIYEARDSHIIFRLALEEGLVQPTEWTGDIAFQTYIIARYNKVIDLLLSLKKAKPIRTPDIKQWSIK